MPLAYLLHRCRFWFTAVSPVAADSQSLEACSPPSLQPGWHVAASDGPAASAGDRAQGVLKTYAAQPEPG